MSRLRFMFVLLSFFVASALDSVAGTQNATVTGLVFQSGAAVPGATVRLINASIGFSQTQVTAADGSFSFSNVPPAEDYLITVEKAGLAPQVRAEVSLHVNEERLEIPPFLMAAATPQTAEAAKPVAVPATAVRTVATELLSSAEGGVVTSRSVHTLPLANRDFIDLALLVPGTYPVEQGSVLQGASLVVNGARADMNNFLLDGADNNDYTINQSLPFQIVEAMQEFRVQSSTSDADFGRNGGAQINVISRSGSNAWHGELLEFNRNSALGANDYFSVYNGGTFDRYAREIALLGGGNALSDPTLAALYNKKDSYSNQNQFGGNIGGPIVKDKLFGFFNWESYRLDNPLPVFEQVPSTTLRNATTCGAAFGAPCNPIAVRIFNLYPSPNVPATGYTDPAGLVSTAKPPLWDPYAIGAFNIGQSANNTSSDNYLGRADWRLNSANSMSFKYNIQNFDQVQAGSVPASANYPGSGINANGRNQNFSYNFVHQFTPHQTNEFRLGWNRFRLDALPLDASIDPTGLGLQNVNFTNQGLPSITIGGFSTFAPFASLGANQAAPSNRTNDVFSFEDNYTWIVGKHTWRFGGLGRHVRLDVDNSALGRGIITMYDPTYVAVLNEPDVVSIARVSSDFGGFGRSLTTNSFDFFAQDQWRVTRNFTLNYGIRYELNTAPVEEHNRLVNYYPSLGTSGGLVRGGQKTIYDPIGQVLGQDTSSAPEAGFDTNTNNWGPRLGFAWDPWGNGKTVFRGGYALVFDQQPLQASVNMLNNPPFVNQDTYVYGIFDGSLNTTFPTLSNCGGGFCGAPYSITGTDPHLKSPYMHQFHFGIEQQLGNRAMVGLEYVGSLGRHLPVLRDVSPCSAQKFYYTFFVSLTDECYNFAKNEFLFPTILQQSDEANSSFHSLQARVETREWHGLQVQAFYQWAKSIDNSSSLQPQLFVFSPSIASLFVSSSGIDPYNLTSLEAVSPALNLQGNLPVTTTRPSLPQSNLGGDRGLSDFDIRHRFVASYIYSIPKWAPKIGTGWQIQGITTLQSGQPLSVYATDFGIPFRPNTKGAVPTDMSNPEKAFNNGLPMLASGSAFSWTPTASFEPGTLGRNSLIGPKFINFDSAISKDIRIAEHASLQLRAEVFNLFNNVNFRQPYSQAGLLYLNMASPGAPNYCGAYNVCVFSDPFFGKILQANAARQIQFAAKLMF